MAQEGVALLIRVQGLRGGGAQQGAEQLSRVQGMGGSSAWCRAAHSAAQWGAT